MNHYKRKKKSKRKTAGSKSTKKHIDNMPAGFQQIEADDVGKLNSFNLPLEEVMENISALSLDIERILGTDDLTIVTFAGDTQGEHRNEAGWTWKMDESYCKEHEFYINDPKEGHRRIKPGDYGFVVWDMRQIDLWTFFVVCHEHRHIWQIKNGFADKWGSKEIELDADAFAVCVSNYIYGCSMMHDKEDEYMAPDGSGTFLIEPEEILKRAEMLDKEVRCAFKEVAAKESLCIDNDRFVWKRLVTFD